MLLRARDTTICCSVVIDDLYSFLAQVSSFLLSATDAYGYHGIFVGMSIESIDIPLPSEIILLYAAISLTYSLDFLAVVLVGTSAGLTGSLVTYVIAFFGGNYLFERYGKYLGITHRELRVTISGLTDMERSPFLSAEWF